MKKANGLKSNKQGKECKDEESKRIEERATSRERREMKKANGMKTVQQKQGKQGRDEERKWNYDRVTRRQRSG